MIYEPSGEIGKRFLKDWSATTMAVKVPGSNPGRVLMTRQEIFEEIERLNKSMEYLMKQLANSWGEDLTHITTAMRAVRVRVISLMDESEKNL